MARIDSRENDAYVLPHAHLLWLATGLFFLRVAGQAIQEWLPQAWLLPATAFQGSSVPYEVLLALQVVLLLLMVRGARFVAIPDNLRAPISLAKQKFFMTLSLVYMSGSLARILIGLTVRDAHTWFSTWIPAGFHLVLASYALVFCHWLRSAAGPKPAKAKS